MKKQFFITFEGIDGSGKDTQLYRLAQAIKDDNGYPFGNKYSNLWITREPTKITHDGRTISRLIREKDVSGEEATKYYVGDRKQHSRIIEKFLAHSHVLSSRYDLSTLSYQMTQGMDFDYLYELHEYNSLNGALIPDITIIFDLPADVAFSRIQKRGESDECFEKIDFLTKARNNMLYCANRLREKGRSVIIVNANQSKDEVTKEMIEKIADVIIKN